MASVLTQGFLDFTNDFATIGNDPLAIQVILAINVPFLGDEISNALPFLATAKSFGKWLLCARPFMFETYAYLSFGYKTHMFEIFPRCRATLRTGRSRPSWKLSRHVNWSSTRAARG